MHFKCKRPREWITKLMRALSIFNNWCQFYSYSVCGLLLAFAFFNFPIKNEIFRKFERRFPQSHDDLIGKHVGKARRIWAEKQTLELQHAHKTTPVSFHVDIPVGSLIWYFQISKYFVKNLNLTTCPLTPDDAMRIFLSCWDFLRRKIIINSWFILFCQNRK